MAVRWLMDLIFHHANALFLHTGGAPSLYHYQPIATQVPGICGVGKVTSSEIKADAEEKKCNY